MLSISHLRSVSSPTSLLPLLVEGGGHVLRLQLPPHAGHLLVGQGHHGEAGLEAALLAVVLLVLLLVSSQSLLTTLVTSYLYTPLPNLLVSLPGVLPSGRLGVMVDVVTTSNIIRS